MLFTTILLGLAATVSAIDIRLRELSGCGGNYIACIGINPNTCCGRTNERFRAVGFVAIPTDWRIQVRAHSGGNCAVLDSAQVIQGSTNACLSEPGGFSRLSGGGYGFLNKRDTLQAAPEQCDAQTCTSTVEPSVFVLGDESAAWDITELSDEQLNKLVCLITFSPSDPKILLTLS